MTTTLFMLLVQAAAWTVTPQYATVGDTTYLTRQFATTPDVRARLYPLVASAELEPLSRPRWVYSEGQLSVIYAVALFETGRHPVVMPDIELVHASGEVQTIVGDTAWIEVVSVLPAQDSAISPMPPRGPVERRRVTPVPAVILVSAVLVLLGVWVVLRRRPGRQVQPEQAQDPDEGPPIDVWVASGESRAVAAVTADRLRDAIAQCVPAAGRHLHTEECIEVVLASDLGEAGRRVAEVLRALERARFSPAAPGDVLEVVDHAEAVMNTLEPSSAEA